MLSEQLYDDARIIDTITNHPITFKLVAQMRNDYEAKLTEPRKEPQMKLFSGSEYDNLEANLAQLNEALADRPYHYSVVLEQKLGKNPEHIVTLYMHRRRADKPDDEFLMTASDLKTVRTVINVLILHLAYKKEMEKG